MNLVIKMAVVAGSAGAELRSETGSSDSNGHISKSRGRKSAVWIYVGFEADKRSRMP